MKCSQDGCGSAAVARYTWPGKDEAAICAAHKPLLERTAAAVGLHLQVIPLEEDEVPRNRFVRALAESMGAEGATSFLLGALVGELRVAGIEVDVIMDAIRRVAGDRPRTSRKFTLEAGHPLVRNMRACAACHAEFQEGAHVTLIPLGPGHRADEQARARAGAPYTATTVVVHWACATGELLDSGKMDRNDGERAGLAADMAMDHARAAREVADAASVSHCGKPARPASRVSGWVCNVCGVLFQVKWRSPATSGDDT